MAAPEPEAEEESEQEDSEGHPRPTPEQLAQLYKGLTSERLQKLIRLADKIKEEESQTLQALKQMDPNFKGDFVNFRRKEVIYAEFVSQVPDLPEDFPFLEIEPVDKIVPRDVEDMKAMNIMLTKVARRLQLALKDLLAAVEATDDGVDFAITEALFRGLCLTGDAFSTLQVERFTTPNTRKGITVSTSDSQIPLVVQKARKDLFFRAGAGAKRAASPGPEEDEGDGGSDSEPPMRKKRREEFNRMQRRFKPSRRPMWKRQRRAEKPRYFKAKPRFGAWGPRQWEHRAAPPPTPP
jgi:hypothetical protein